MNAVLQIFLNSNILKSIFLHENFNRTINFQNKFGFKGKVINEFIKLLKEKWLAVPNYCQELPRSQFQNFDQQDANDFLNFLLDALHEETNLKKEKIFIPNPDLYNGTIYELASEYWANNLRRNVSFIHSLFLGQMKSTLTCMKCGSEKVSFETFSTLNVPIPQKGIIMLDVILHRLPFTFKIYYNKIQHKNNNFISSDMRNQLVAIRKKSLEMSIDLDTFLNDANESQLSEKSKIVNMQRLSTVKTNNEKETDRKDKSYNLLQVNSSYNLNKIKLEEFYTSNLSITIPIKISLEINKKNKVGKIIDIIKKRRELELEENLIYTNFLILNRENKFVFDDLLIDECFQNNQVLNIFEVLNYNGLCKLFNYQQIEFTPLNKDCINYFNKTSQIIKNLNNGKNI